MWPLHCVMAFCHDVLSYKETKDQVLVGGFLLVGVIFQKIWQNGRPGGREAPQSTSFHETSRTKSVWGRGHLFFCLCFLGRKELMTSVRKPRTTMRERVPTLQNSKKGHQKWAASPPTLRAGFSSVGGVEHARAYISRVRDEAAFGTGGSCRSP